MDIKTIPDSFVDETWQVMAFCPQHTFLILTKRPQRMLEAISNLIPKYGILPNVWLGCTVVNQQEADEKIPIFLEVPGKKFLSIEPMLGPINLEMALEEFQPLNPDFSRKPPPMSAVILGGETGPGARPMNPDWVRSVRDQCLAAGVPFFFKGWGRWRPDGKGKMSSWVVLESRLLDGKTYDSLPWK